MVATHGSDPCDPEGSWEFDSPPAYVTCKVDSDNCSPGPLVRGMCRRHYDRWRRYGDTLDQLAWVVTNPVSKEKILQLHAEQPDLYQYEIAAILGCSQTSVCRILNGQRQADVVGELAQRLLQRPAKA